MTLPQPVSRALRSPRIVYKSFTSVEGHREYLLGLDGAVDARCRIPLRAFDTHLVLMQEGPDVCYQTLQGMLEAGACPDTSFQLTLTDDDLARYRRAHETTRGRSRRRSWTPSTTPSVTPAAPARTGEEIPPPVPTDLASSSATNAEVPIVQDVMSLAGGERVEHAVFGAGVTTSCDGGHTVIAFDAYGSRTFVTARLELQVLSAPGTWEVGPRGRNRPRVDPHAERPRAPVPSDASRLGCPPEDRS